MKFLVDAQLPPALAVWLRENGHDAKPVREVGLRDANDEVIWAYAKRMGAVILTKDEDFAVRSEQVADARADRVAAHRQCFEQSAAGVASAAHGRHRPACWPG